MLAVVELPAGSPKPDRSR